MIPRRTPPILRENSGESHDAATETGGPTVRASGSVRLSAPQVAGSIKQLFRQVMKVLTCQPEPAPRPAGKKRQGGETAAGFTLAGRRATLQLMSRFSVAKPAVGFLQEAVAWLDLWAWNEHTGDPDVFDGPEASDNNHLSLRL
jgi:hypothetical protein